MTKGIRNVVILVILVSIASNWATFRRTAAQDTNCTNSANSGLEVGNYASTLPTAAQYLKRGNPYESGGLETTETWQPTDDDVILLVEGPVCYEGTYFWRIQPPLNPFVFTEDFSFPPLDTNFSLWLPEFADNEDMLILAETPQYDVAQTILGVERAPIIDAAMQLSYLQPGGGGEGEPPPCAAYMGNHQTTVTQYNTDEMQACLPIHFPLSAETTIHVYHNNMLYVEAIGESNMQYWYIPMQPEYPLGTWIVEFRNLDSTYRIAYQIIGRRGLNNQCMDYYPTLTLMGYLPNEAITLVTFLDSIYYAQRDTGLLLESNAYETETVNVDDGGSVIAYYGHVFVQPRYIFTEDVFLSIEVSMVVINTIYPLFCPSPPTLDYAKQHIIELDRLISGRLGGENPDPIYYVFEGTADQRVTITLVAFEDAFDPVLELYDASETRVADNDDAETAVFGELNAQIADFVIPTDGQYTISISRVSAESGSYLLIVN